MHLYPKIKIKLHNYLKLRHPIRNPQILNSGRIYIVPSLFGWAYGFVMFSIATGAINYQLNPAYFLIFTLMIIGLLSMWQTHQNLKDLRIECLSIEDVSQGKFAKIHLTIKGKSKEHFALHLSIINHESIPLAQVSSRETSVILSLETPKRGHFAIPTIKIHSYFPLRLFRVWSYLRFDSNYFVYPRPISPGFWPNAESEIAQKSSQCTLGDSDLYELKSIENPWVQPSRIAWKISARKQGWYLKNLSSEVANNWVFRINSLYEADLERCLQHLSYWIINAERMGQSYGLELKGKLTIISQGKHHMQQCLRQLALY